MWNLDGDDVADDSARGPTGAKRASLLHLLLAALGLVNRRCSSRFDLRYVDVGFRPSTSHVLIRASNDTTDFLLNSGVRPLQHNQFPKFDNIADLTATHESHTESDRVSWLIVDYTASTSNNTTAVNDVERLSTLL